MGQHLTEIISLRAKNLRQDLKLGLVGACLWSSAVVGLSAGATAQVATDAISREGFALRFAHPDVLACLDKPTRDCALAAPVQALLVETAEAEQASILIGIAEALVDLGDTNRAQITLRLALQKAEASGFPILIQQRLQEIAPLMAKAGDAAKAEELALGVRFGTQRDNALTALAAVAAAAGDVVRLRALTSQLRNKTRSFWTELNLLGQMPAAALKNLALDDYLTRVRAMQRSDFAVRGLGLVAIIAHKQGDIAARDTLLDELASRRGPLASGMITASVMALLVEAMDKAGLPDDLIAPYYGIARQNLAGSAGSDDFYANFVRRVAPFVSRSDFAGGLIGLLDRLDQPQQKLAVINHISSDTPADLADRLFQLARQQILLIERALQRDIQRVRLADTAARLKNLDALKAVALTMEDDDGLARALARMAPLLS